MTSIEFIKGLKSQGVLEGMTIGDAYPAYKEETQDSEDKDSFMKFRSAFILYGDGKTDIPGTENIVTVDKQDNVEKSTKEEEVNNKLDNTFVEPSVITEELKEVLSSGPEIAEPETKSEDKIIPTEKKEEKPEEEVITPVNLDKEETKEIRADEAILDQVPTKSEAKIIKKLEKELLDDSQETVITKSPITDKDDLPVRVVKTYCNGEKLPDVPGLIPTGTMFDKLICDRFTTPKQLDDYLSKYGEEMPDDKFEAGGFTRKCVDIVAGGPGAGKTTNLCTLAAKAKIFNRRELGKEIKVSFISAEMRESEWAKELRDSELLRELEVTYMLDYVGFDNYEDIFWEAFADGDIVICDSFPAVVDHIRMSPKEKRTEKAITADFIRKSLKSVTKNDNNVQLINQATKDGNYKGGTILPHMLSSLSFVRLDGERRFWEYRKNRNNGKVGRRGYFGRTESRDIEFDEDLYESTYEQIADKNQSIEELMNSLNTNPEKKEMFESLGENDSNENITNTEEYSEKESKPEAEEIVLTNEAKEEAPVIEYMGRALPNGQTDLEDLIDNAVAENTLPQSNEDKNEIPPIVISSHKFEVKSAIINADQILL